MWKIRPDLKHVATLPSEIIISANSNNVKQVCGFLNQSTSSTFVW